MQDEESRHQPIELKTGSINGAGHDDQTQNLGGVRTLKSIVRGNADNGCRSWLSH